MSRNPFNISTPDGVVTVLPASGTTSASSKRTLDIDILTYQDLYLKSQSTEQISSYTIPVIPSGSNVYKLFHYFSPEQVLSTAGLTFTPSTIPDISNALITLSVNQIKVVKSLSSISTLAGADISSFQSTTNAFYNFQVSTLYYSSYTQLINSFNILQGQNVQVLSLQGTIINLGNSISTLSTQFQPTFCTFGSVLENTFNQGDAVSTLSTYFINYYTEISTSVQSYSTTIGTSISSVIGNDASTMIGYTIETNNIIQSASGTGVSTLSTLIGSTLAGFESTIVGYDPTVGIQNISTFVDGTISSLSSAFITDSGIPGICSLSTKIQRQYISSILQAQNVAGTPGLCTMSTYLNNIYKTISTGVGFSQGNTVSTFSTNLQTQINLINTAVGTVGYAYVILQQEAVSVSLSTLSSVFGVGFNSMNTLSSFSTMLPSVYSTIDTVFSLQSPYSTLQALSTVEGSNISTTKNYISSVYPSIFCGPGLSSLSTFINPNFSSISTSLTTLFSSFSNSIYNISSIRTDPGVSSLSTFVNSNMGVYYSSYSLLNQSVITISQQSASTISLFYVLSTNDAITYSNFNPAGSITALNNTITSFSNYNNGQYTLLATQTSNASSFVSTFSKNLYSSYVSVQSSFSNILGYLVSSYTSVSTVVEANIYAPTFLSFTTNSLTTSNLVVNTNLYLSSVGILTSTSGTYPFSMLGSAKISSRPDPSTNHILAGVANLTGNTTFLNSNLPYSYRVSPNDPGFSVQANSIAYNGSLWVIVGETSVGSNIKYTTNPTSTWSNATTPFGIGAVNTVKWSGSYWLAGTSGSTDLLISRNGIVWTNAAPAVRMDAKNDIAWNGVDWVAVGNNDTGDPAQATIEFTDINGVWQLGSNAFTGQGNAVTTNGRTWVALGTGASVSDAKMKYSFNASNWTDVTVPQLSTGNAVAWNGDLFLAGGSNGNSSNLMYSYNGVTWTYSQSPSGISTVNSIAWDGQNWNIAGTAGSLQKLALSSDAINWSLISTSFSTGKINTIGYSSNTTPTIQLSNFDIFSGDIPAFMNTRHRMNVIHSTIYFNDGSLTIRKQNFPNQNLGNIGINTTFPEYSLDIATGNARKPIGTNWVTASDARVKTEIETVDLVSCAKLVSEIPLRTYSFTSKFQDKTGIKPLTYYGFIAQEVKQVLPNSVTYTKEHGLDDFHSLDTDQIFKLEFGATQYLLSAVQKLEAQISTLEACKLK
jgi:hypothetical protein